MLLQIENECAMTIQIMICFTYLPESKYNYITNSNEPTINQQYILSKKDDEWMDGNGNNELANETKDESSEIDNGVIDC